MTGPVGGAAVGGVVGARIVTMVPGEAPFLGHLLWDEQGRIAAVGPGAPPAGVAGQVAPGGIVDLAGAVVVPGFVSGHAHLWQAAFRGVADGCRCIPWIERLHRRIGPRLGADDLAAFTVHGAADSVRNGVTTVCNMSQDLGSGAIGQLAAARRGPGRTVHVEGLAADLSEAQRRERIEALAAESADADRVLGLAVDVSDWGMDVPAMARESALVAGLGLTTHTHYLEDPTVAHLGRARFADLVAGGRIAPGLVVAHFIHTTPEIVRETARRGAAMVWNPLSNGRLGSGLPDVLAYREAGLPIGLGLDGQASADLSDPFENMRMGLYAVRMRAQDAGVLLAADVLRMHTIDAARALGVGDLVGSLEPGKLADFVVVDAEGPATGPVGEDLLAHLVLACSARDIRSVHVGGRAVAVDGTESADGAGSASGIGSVSGMGSEWRDLRDRVRRILAG